MNSGDTCGFWVKVEAQQVGRAFIIAKEGAPGWTTSSGYHQRLELICNLLHENVRIRILIVVFNYPPIDLFFAPFVTKNCLNEITLILSRGSPLNS